MTSESKLAAIIDTDPMVFKILHVLLKQANVDSFSFQGEQLDVRSIRKSAKDFLFFNADPLEDKDTQDFRMKCFRELLRSDDLSHTKVILTTKNAEDKKVQSLLNVNKLDALLTLPLDAMEVTTLVNDLKDKDPKRTVWRSSWK